MFGGLCIDMIISSNVVVFVDDAAAISILHPGVGNEPRQ